jgi:SNF2 family DNA or RNA helicase
MGAPHKGAQCKLIQLDIFEVVAYYSFQPMMLQLLMLLFCHPQVVQHVSAQLEKNTIYLQHPVSYEPSVHGGFKYYNPHGSMYQSADAERRRREVMSGLGGTYTSRYPAQAPKSVEVQREQVEDMFKSMKSGADLGEAEPDPAVSTQMYPHQKQALAFLLDREKLRNTDNLKVKKKEMTEAIDQEDDTNMISLWKPRRDMYGRFVGWHNVVTEVEFGSERPPPQCRGAILADDMGLGKTIVIIALIATTRSEAKLFSATAPTKDRLGTSFDALAAHPVGKQAGQAVSLGNSGFSTPIFGKTNGVSTQDVLSGLKGGSKGKKKGESKTQKKREELEEARLKKLKTRSRGTLIVCPLSTVVNWESQLDEHIGISSSTIARKRRGDDSGTSTPTTPAGLSVYIYHGNNRTSDLEILADHDVVITTFSTLGSEYSRQARKEEQDEEGSSSSDGGIEELDSNGEPVKRKGKKRKRKKIDGNADSALQQIEWFRVVLDEAQYVQLTNLASSELTLFFSMIKEHTTIQARACCALMAERRVCLTGTPVQNSLNDLFSLLRFLRLEPFTDRGIWSSYVGSPCKVGDPLGVSRLQLIMRHLALRRTKNSTDKEGKPILSIPPKKDEIKYLQLDEQEKAFYSAHHRRYKHNFEMLEKSDSLLKNYCSILQEVLRLRQICAHMGLVRDSEDRADLAKGDDAGDVVSAIKAHGISKRRALRLLALMRDTGAAQCGECGVELASGGLSTSQDPDEEDVNANRKKKARSSRRTVKEENDCADANASTQTPVLTKCQHLFCLECFKTNICPKFPNISATERSTCSICREEISPVIDAVQIAASDIDSLGAGDGDEDTTSQRGSRTVEHSTKIRYVSLLDGLYLSKQAYLQCAGLRPLPTVTE